MITRILLVVSALMLLLPAVARAERVALLPASGTNLHEGYLQAAQDVARGHLEAAGYEVVTLDGPNGTREPGGSESSAAARSAGAHYAVVVHVTRLANTAKVKLTAYDAATGQVVYRDQLTAGTPDDIDPVLERLAQGMATGRPAEDTADIHTVTQKEEDPLRKRMATNVRGVRIGVVAPLGRPGGDEDAIPGLGIFWLYDVRTFLADVSIDFHTKDGESDFTIGLGSYYPLSEENTAPYIGGGLRYGAADYGGALAEGASGVSVHLSAGVLIGRLSSVQLRGQLDYFLNLFSERDMAGAGTRSNGLMASFGIGF